MYITCKHVTGTVFPQTSPGHESSLPKILRFPRHDQQCRGVHNHAILYGLRCMALEKISEYLQIIVWTTANNIANGVGLDVEIGGSQCDLVNRGVAMQNPCLKLKW
jgi:hypothetical protein